jgi:hypothetical protein
MATRLLKIAVAYMMIGVTTGLVMGLTHRFQYAPVHAHLNLLGWASLGLASLIYHLYPHAAKTWLARCHFWLHNLGLPVFMLGLFALLSGDAAAQPVVGIGATVTYLGVLSFVINVMRTVGPGNAAAEPPVGGDRLVPHIAEWK